MTDVVPVGEWHEATAIALGEFVTNVLGLEEFVLNSAEEGAAQSDSGGYIQLLTERESVQLGFATTFDDCVKMARLMLVLEEDEPDPPVVEVRDAMGEVANVVAGTIKTMITEKYECGMVQLGLPFFVHGKIALVAGLTQRVMRLACGGIECDVHVGHMPHPPEVRGRKNLLSKGAA